MKQADSNLTTRREFIGSTGKLAAASALSGIAIPAVHGAEGNTLQVTLVGCGGRGGGAVMDAIANAKNGPMRLVAMADVFEARVKHAFDAFKEPLGSKLAVTDERKFVGFDAYKHAMDALRPGDVVILATPLAFRSVHFAYAIQRRLNVFMEKPLSADGPTTQRIIELGRQATAANLKVAVGLMCRHCRARQALNQRLKDGAIGELVMQRAYRMQGPSAICFAGPKKPDEHETLYQIRNFHSFLWAGGGLYSDFNIHQVDEMCWMKDGWPVKAEGIGGRHYRGKSVDQNFDTYSVEYTFADGTKALHYSRVMDGCQEAFSTFAHGTKGVAVICQQEHTRPESRIYRGQSFEAEDAVVWRAAASPNPYKEEWVDFIDAIRSDRPYNEVEIGAKASLVTSMGRYAAHTGFAVTYEQAMGWDVEYAPGLDKLTLDSPAPLVADKDGRYPVPEPGKKKNREC